MEGEGGVFLGEEFDPASLYITLVTLPVCLKLSHVRSAGLCVPLLSSPSVDLK